VEVSNMLRYPLAVLATACGVWLLTLSIRAGSPQNPRSALLCLLTAVVSFALAYTAWNKRLGLTVVLGLLLYVAIDLCAVFVPAAW